MRALIQRLANSLSPEGLVEQLMDETGVVLLRSSAVDMSQARYSFVAARPFLTFRCWGSRCETRWGSGSNVSFGDPWRLLQKLLARYELPDEIDLPFPLGGCFGYWGYELKNFIEPRLASRALNDLEMPDCHLGFYDSLVAFDHHLDTTWLISSGLQADGSRSEERAREQCHFWAQHIGGHPNPVLSPPKVPIRLLENLAPFRLGQNALPSLGLATAEAFGLSSNLSQNEFMARVERAQSYIRSGDIYQVNLSQRLTAGLPCSGWELFQALGSVSPAPFAAYVDAGDLQLASSSPELFLRMSGSRIQTRPIKGTRPRSADPTQDSQLSYQLQTSAKEMSELVMITDLLRNDLGRVCEFGSVHVPELARLERYAQVQHLVSTVEGSLRPEITHLGALAACFPGGSITGAPKVRAMEIIEELEPVSRGPYTGAIGYLGFNRESQLSIIIRTALCKGGLAHFPVGAGVVADSNIEAEYFETLAKARGFVGALQFCSRTYDRVPQRQICS